MKSKREDLKGGLRVGGTSGVRPFEASAQKKRAETNI